MKQWLAISPLYDNTVDDLTVAAPANETNFTTDVALVDTDGDGVLTLKQHQLRNNTHLKLLNSRFRTQLTRLLTLVLLKKSVELQKDFLSNLTDQIDEGVGAMIDANMEQEAAKLQALQVQQQLSQHKRCLSLTKPHQLMSLFK